VVARTPVTVAIDAGTTGVRALVIDDRARVLDIAYRELTQYFPRPGWVEHDPGEIWSTVRSTLAEVAARIDDTEHAVRAIGITNQRETVVAWDRSTGLPHHRALVWQDRRTAAACRALAEAGHLPLVRRRTGLVLDPYFSGTKMQWLLGPGGVPAGPDLAMGTVDAWLLWNLTGGIANGVFATDSTNASRTMLFDIVDRRWSDELCDLFAIPMAVLPEVHPSCGRFGLVDGSLLGGSSPIAGVPVSAMAGDQHAALFGQACFDPGMVKATIGTGSFILMNAGAICPEPVDGLLTTIAWDLGADGGDSRTAGRDPFAYAVEGSVFVAGAGVQWLRDGLGIITGSSDLEPLARTVDSSEGVVIVPAFTGLGSPQWDPSARGTIVGLSRGSGRAQVARAMIEAMGFQARDVLDAMCTTGTRPSVVRVDGGAAVMDLLLEHLADQARLDVLRPRSVESTAIGAATMAGLAEGVWSSLDDLAELWDEEAAFSPAGSDAQVEIAHEAWLRAVERSRGWTGDAD